MKQTWLCCTMCFKPQTALSSGGQAAALSARRPSPKVRESYVVLSFLFFVNETLGSALDADACFTAWQLGRSFKGGLGSGSLPRFLSHFLSSFRIVGGWGRGDSGDHSQLKTMLEIHHMTCISFDIRKYTDERRH